MKKFSFRILAATLAFIVGVFVTSALIFIDFSNLRVSDVQPPNNSVSKEEDLDDNLIELSNEDEEYAVYSAVIADCLPYKDKPVIVIDSTFKGGSIFQPEDLNKEFFDVTEDIVTSYQLKNKTSRSLENRFNVSNEIHLTSEKEVERMFRNSHGWKKFYEKYKTAQSLISFSAIGFNNEKSKALVYVSHSCGGLCGSGNFVILRKLDGKWLVDRKKTVWVS